MGYRDFRIVTEVVTERRTQVWATIGERARIVSTRSCPGHEIEELDRTIEIERPLTDAEAKEYLAWALKYHDIEDWAQDFAKAYNKAWQWLTI